MFFFWSTVHKGPSLLFNISLSIIISVTEPNPDPRAGSGESVIKLTSGAESWWINSELRIPILFRIRLRILNYLSKILRNLRKKFNILLFWMIYLRYLFYNVFFRGARNCPGRIRILPPYLIGLLVLDPDPNKSGLQLQGAGSGRNMYRSATLVTSYYKQDPTGSICLSILFCLSCRTLFWFGGFAQQGFSLPFPAS